MTKIDPAAGLEIERRLFEICRVERVAVPLAVESGSRAWGFPSPDSDYDCRFLYVRPVAQHLTPWPLRDVIERPLDGVFDLNGWDLSKALRLLLKGNAVVLEWLQSPITYRSETGFGEALLDWAERHVDRALLARHYLHLGERQRRIYFSDTDCIPLKKMFYAVRPAAVLRWLRLRPERTVPPMHFPQLMAECDPSPALSEIVAGLLARKAVTRELGSGRLPAVIAKFVDDEFRLAREAFATGRQRLSEAAQVEAEALYRDAVLRESP